MVDPQRRKRTIDAYFGKQPGAAKASKKQDGDVTNGCNEAKKQPSCPVDAPNQTSTSHHQASNDGGPVQQQAQPGANAVDVSPGPANAALESAPEPAGDADEVGSSGTGGSSCTVGAGAPFSAVAGAGAGMGTAAVAGTLSGGSEPFAGGLVSLLSEPSWKEALLPEFGKPYFQSLEKFVLAEMAGKTVYPPRAHVFRAFNSCPFEQVKVVVIGQDPYHGPGQAVGLSFSVPRGVKVPSSLQNIFKELRDDVGCAVPPHGDLGHWASQGVLLLNASLTVRGGEANSHSKRGWEALTDAAIRTLAARRRGIVFLLWGKFAQDKAKLIDPSRHHVLTAPHPSGLSAHRGFFKCKHFSKANVLLRKAGADEIDWCIPP